MESAAALRNQKISQKDQGSDPVGVIAPKGAVGVCDEHIVAKKGVYRNCVMCCKCPPTDYYKEPQDNVGT